MKYPNILPLRGIIQDYDWGGYQYISGLTGQQNPDRQPQAELWMGTHNRGPATVTVNGSSLGLDRWIATDPVGILGEKVAQRFGGHLPFLFKILDVRKMLSIQAHPTKAAAEAGYRRENEAGIPLEASDRNYKDENHKPEIMVALSHFWLLHGFSAPAHIEQVLEGTPEFRTLQPIFSERGIKGLYQYIMELPQERIDELLAPMATRLEPALETAKLDRSQPEYWAAQAFRDYTQDGHYDRGVFSIFLFNLVYIEQGNGIFQDANIPHAYLEGVNVELMANSDNVFRGGLTAKHVDVGELMQHLRFEPVRPNILRGKERLPHERVFPAPVPDFELSRIDLSAGDRFLIEKQDGPAIYILISGEIQTPSGKLTKGEIFFSPHGAVVELEGVKEALLFRAGTPVAG